MQRQIGTALAVLGLLLVGSGAAALNSRVLSSSGFDTGNTNVDAVRHMTMMGGTAPIATIAPSPAASERTAGSQAGKTRPAATARPSSKASDEPRSDDSSAARSGPGSHMGMHRDAAQRRPELTDEQRNLLRIAAMAHVPPPVVLAAARGDDVDPEIREVIEDVAEYIGVDLESLADLQVIPQLIQPGHGSPNEHGGMNFDD